jgi:two-component system chemotaxis sensor kinase CheA
VVIKSLEQHYKRVQGIAGATIMGDGSVALIVDVESLALTVNSNMQLAG